MERAKLQAKHLNMTVQDFLARKELLRKQAESLKEQDAERAKNTAS